ncbi:ATP-binding cassette domain-containing protein [Herbidospora galbida]|uniref:ATP-binding cassette domain-containing protein n=1 Tax=Herbidospora galbida TaxID=2575442 RepID=A0A4U3MJE8_9ACTN|nr:ATP-binding cassette domain-containing protein [Herbidospora galbida]TKK89020.1 ATP-binding cassette domain-containing protein [Herbidospora galbida]
MITARALTRTFKGVPAVRAVDLDVYEGEICGFLGPNGAGKTTTLRMLTTLLRPTSGAATVAGHDLVDDPAGVRGSIGYVAQGGMFTPLSRIGDELRLQARLYGHSAREARRRTGEVLDRLDLGGFEQRTPASLSGGQARRADLALGLIHTPKVLFLDEPTNGLDPRARAELWTYIRGLKTTIFLSTHYLDEADALCDRVLIIDGGRIVASGSPADLKRDHAAKTLDEVFLTVTGRPMEETAA